MVIIIKMCLTITVTLIKMAKRIVVTLIMIYVVIKHRSSHPDVFCKNGDLRNFAKLTGKHLRHYFNKVGSLRPATSFKKRLWHKCFPVNFAKFLRTPFLKEHLWRLLLDTGNYNEQNLKVTFFQVVPKCI